ncbi:acetyl/acyl transferase related protein [Ignisphaera aggregans DSM 17230]|uniref:Acetyl/acyl transferase related protein n=1 Tax=Ignisphaera aggregans (strain DSM 17230 / JCM 13409 / AQ1.S1) TaxID=583356 RepID=E0SP35_IGNAA|nr:acetyl/acyl transferase related protein [Ignisphaera aggregans DSM 17230]
MVFIGKRAKILTRFVGDNVDIYGESFVGTNSFIDSYTTIGFPIRAKLKSLSNTDMKNINEILDEISEGSFIGNNVVIRRGSIIYERTTIKENVEFGHNVLVRENTIIGAGCKIGSGTIIDGEVLIGENTVVQSFVYIPPKVKIGSNVFIAPRVTFTNDRYPPSKRLIETIIEDDVVIGANSTIIAGITIGKGAIIAAGSVVTKSVKPYSVVMGVPAKVVMDRNEYEQRKRLYEESEIFPIR